MNLKTPIAFPELLRTGDVVNNGFYDIRLCDWPKFNEDIQRWQCLGCRWLPSKREWQDKVKLYGWQIAYVPEQYNRKPRTTRITK